MAVGDLSRPHGGDFGPRFGYIGHASHQNGLDADVYYPRADGTERAPRGAGRSTGGCLRSSSTASWPREPELVFVGPPPASPAGA